MCRRQADDEGKPITRVVGHKVAFELSWNKDEVKKLLDSSFTKCRQFHVGFGSLVICEVIKSRFYIINDEKDFLNGKFEDLMDMGRLGVSYDHDSLYLVDGAN